MVNCVVCKKENAQPCSTCQLMHYCGSKCYNKDWKNHRIICRSAIPKILKQNYQIFKSFKPGMVFAIVDEDKKPVSADLDFSKNKWQVGIAEVKDIKELTIQFKEFQITIPGVENQLEGDENLDMVVRQAKIKGFFDNMEKDRILFWMKVEEQPQSDAKISEVVEPKRTFVPLSDMSGQVLGGSLAKVMEDATPEFKKALAQLKDYNNENFIYIMHANDNNKIVLSTVLRTYITHLTE